MPVCTVCAVSRRSYAATLRGLLPLSDDVRNTRGTPPAPHREIRPDVSRRGNCCATVATIELADEARYDAAALFTRAATSAHAGMSWSKERASPTITSSADMAA